MWQQAASDVLVEIGKYEPDLVCTAILPHMQAGQLPPFFVLQTIGSLAEANREAPFSTLAKEKDVLPISQRVAWSISFVQCSAVSYR